MKTYTLRSNLFLLLAAAIWGFAFVAQRVGMKYIGPFTYNGIRFALGGLSLIPLILVTGRKGNSKNSEHNLKAIIPAGLTVGVVLFLGASLQQIGLEGTSAGKAAFITGLYIVLVPVFGLFLKQYVRLSTWIGVLVAISGLYLLCVTDTLSVSKYDMFELFGAFFWSIHILTIDYFIKKVDGLKLALTQFITCSVLSLVIAFAYEHITIDALKQAAIPILYGGICSVGVAYTLQIIGQKHANPSHAAIILSLETAFAGLGGWIILGENLGTRGYIGCALMFAGMLLSQLQNFKKKSSDNKRVPQNM
ncbi:MAG: DMT family transporter [Bacillota bacterium]|nr:DMT family transporter [Bacillota bacterium]